ncbi:MAG TPA: RHS repeat-associated core domain-containing protein [Solirubrobacteraceae bacterium]|nr:RHS repeat-associated core domain-containing protein [Solirubrobacteraceae bacterium]
MLVVSILAVVSLCLAVFRAPLATAALTEAESAHMPEIVQWVYRMSAIKDPLACSELCEQLDTAAQSGGPWDPIAALEMGLGLWASPGELRSRLLGVALSSSQLRVGWHIDTAVGGRPGEKWMEIRGPSSPCEGGKSSLRLEGESVGSSFYEHPHAPVNSWYLEGCEGLGENEANYVKEVIKPTGFCVPLFVRPPLYGGWERQDFHWNQCGEAFGFAVPEVPQYASVYRLSFHFGRAVAWEHQHLEGGGTKNIETNVASDPGEATVLTATESALERGGQFRVFVDWLLAGAPGANPLGATPTEGYGQGNGGEPKRKSCFAGEPVNCATGNETQTQRDLWTGGRGPALQLIRTYNSQLARSEGSPGPFGFGWSGSFSAHMQISEETDVATVVQDDASTVRFAPSEGGWVPLSRLVQATLAKEGSEYLYTLPSRTVLRFDGSGQLLSETDRSGNALTMTRGGGGRLEAVTDSAGRKITLTYNGEGRVASAKDPMGHVVKYTYEVGCLTSVTDPGEASPAWKFKYNGSHELTEETDGRGHTVTSEYDGSGRVVVQADALSRERKWEYAGSEASPETTITEPNGSKTVETFNALDEPTSVTRASGTEEAATRHYEYNEEGELIGAIDPTKHRVSYEYDAAGDLTGEQNADGDTRQWSYDSTHDVISSTTPRGEATTTERDANGNAIKVSRPAPGGETQSIKLKYAANGDLESVEDPLKRTTKYEYDSNGARTAEIDPEGDERTWAYDADSNETSTVSPRGHEAGAEESKFTTTIERDAQERPIKVTDPLKHETKYAYDADGNLESETDPIGNVTSYSYDADDEPISVKEPSGTVTETEYDSEGQVSAQIDGEEHTTKYTRNGLGEVTEVKDPLGRKTLEEYDAAGNLTKLTDATKRTTKYSYDPANRLSEVDYSSEATPDVEYEYDADGNRTKMIDGTGTSKYTYDQLDRLVESKDGHGDVVGYEYDLANEQTKITYPSGKSLLRAFDKAGRLESVTDWLEHTSKFAYDADSEQISTTFPASTGDVDQYAYEADDAMQAVTMKKGSEVLASLEYTRNKDAQVTKATSEGLPGEEESSFTYDENSRLSKGAGIKYAYDAANDATGIASSTLTYDAASELEKSSSTTYSYDELGERTGAVSTGAGSFSYGYDQADELTSVSRPKSGELPAIEDSYGYEGDGLRTSQTISGTTGYMSWDAAEALPLLLGDGTSSFVYGPNGLPIEQIAGEAVQYLHHDQQGSTRLITSASGTVAGATTFDAYGDKLGSTGSATSALGYDGQYTSADTGLVYLRARVYDASTGQFLSRDPLERLTRAPYSYASNDPANRSDPSGQEVALPIGGAGGEAAGGATLCADPVTAAACVAAGGYVAVNAAKSVVNAWAGEEAGNDEGAETLEDNQSEEAECEAAGRIAGGHAFEKHAGELGLQTRDGFEQEIKDVIERASKVKGLTNGRTAYYDPESNTLVIVDPASPDGGTVFRPSGGEDYFNDSLH